MERTAAERPSIAAIVLAAGTSSRMGAHKLLLPLGDRPIIAHIVAAVLSCAVSPVVVILGRDADRVTSALPPQDVTVVVNPDYATGMASSLRAGMDALPAQSLGAILLLGDQPLVTPALIASVLAEANAHPGAIVSASFGGQRGHPVYFPRHLFGELSMIQGDEGGRNVIARHGASLLLVDWPDISAGLDVDTMDEYARLKSLWAAHSEDISR